jgi:hypothetical protein
MTDDPKVRALHLASLIGEAATGRPVHELVSAAVFAGWIDELLERHGCSEPPRLPETARSGFLGAARTERSGASPIFEEFFLRLELKMAQATYRHLVAPGVPEDATLLARFEELVGERAQPSARYFQGLVDRPSSLRRAIAMNERIGSGLSSVLFVGDDDTTSVAFALIAPQHDIRVIDIDERVLEVIRKASALLDVPIVTETVDLRQGVPFHLARRFDGVATDPPRNYRSCMTFLRFAEGCLSAAPRARIYWSDHPDWNFGHAEVMASLPRLGLRCDEILPELHVYPDPLHTAFDAEAWTADPDDPDDVMGTYFQILDALARRFELDPHWVREVARWSWPWSHLHVLARATAPP